MSEGCSYLAPKKNAHGAILRHLPTWWAWVAFCIPGKNAYKLLAAIATAFDDLSVFICAALRELDPQCTEDLIGEWETAVGLPDACLPRGLTIEDRRKWVWFRLNKRRWTTEAEWHELAALFGVTIQITRACDLYSNCGYVYEYPLSYGYPQLPKEGRFRLYIDITDGCDFTGYTYDYPVPYGSSPADCDQFVCFIERIKPANVIIIWNNTPTSFC